MSTTTKDSWSKIRDEALVSARAFCRENNLSAELLENQKFFVMGDVAYFAQEMEYHGGGLEEDLASQPKPTLEYAVDTKTITPTEYTVRYLKIT